MAFWEALEQLSGDNRRRERYHQQQLDNYQQSIWDQVATPRQVGPGQQTGLFNMDPMGNSSLGQPQPTVPVPTSLLDNRQAQAQFWANTMANPQYKEQGAAGLRQQMDREWQGQNTTAYQRQKLEQDYELGMAKLGQDRAMALGQLGMTPARIDALGDKYSKEVEPLEISQNQARYVDQLMNSGEALTGPGMEAVSSAFLTAIRPGEAQMEGDVARLARSIGIKGTLSEFMAYMQSNPSAMQPYLEQMHEIIRKRATLDAGRMAQKGKEMSRAFNLNERQLNQILWRGDKPYVAPITADDKSKIPADAVPVDSQRIPLPGYGGKFGG